MYSVFPEWKEKKTSTQNALLFHRHLEKRNFDEKRHFCGKSNDVEFCRRLELFLCEVEKRGLDWRRCIQKLRRRCCDLLRFGRTSHDIFEMESKLDDDDCLSVIEYIAQQALSEMQRHNRESPQ